MRGTWKFWFAIGLVQAASGTHARERAAGNFKLVYNRQSVSGRRQIVAATAEEKIRSARRLSLREASSTDRRGGGQIAAARGAALREFSKAYTMSRRKQSNPKPLKRADAASWTNLPDRLPDFKGRIVRSER
ncbi:hypothetical protein B566_EDAN014474 [Ephemera danica]|nr:hypothetical protein B566_EDAN014474 [Ephemera danica]